MAKQQKRKSAVALKYDGKKDNAPRVTAKGKGAVAEKILWLAKKHNICIKEDPALIAILSQLDINREIPSHLYKVVAEIFSFIYSVNGRIG